MNFSKAFDKVELKRIFLKLRRFGINNDVIIWIVSFLSNRTQRAELEGGESDPCSVMPYVPLGTLLGHCLFLWYIKDTQNVVMGNIRLFADDTIMYNVVSSQSVCQALHSDLANLETWESEWLMALNAEKSPP